MKVNQDTILGELLEEYPGTEEVLRKYLGEAYCLTCPGKMFDTVGNGALLHGLSEADTESMLQELQQVVQNEAKREEKEEANDIEE
ncbi:MAG TPA: hypothetical protein VJB65_04120 [Patescibacteria group bacterium]|nr:hypothetical protein [Patescibacteria group bacterium]